HTAFTSISPPNYSFPDLELLFISCSYHAHLSLHSFPTRRSSDLLRPEPRDRARRGGLAVVGGDELRPARADDAVQGEVGGRGVRDRKSTRLNSSPDHLVCRLLLEKKKPIHEDC